MSSDIFDSPRRNPVAELPLERLERAMALRNGLISLCEGQGKMVDEVYRVLRLEFMNDPTTKTLVPQFVRSAHDTGSMWAFLKSHSGQWAPRRQFVRDQFVSLINYLESGASPADFLISDTLISFDAQGVTDAWQKALSRRETDPSGAVTSARTLLESVCKHILEDDTGAALYSPNDDLPKLYKFASERLNIAPSQHSEEVFRRILGSVSSVVEGLGALRNKIGDAHDPGRKRFKVAPRHAALAINLAGSMALFLVETANARSQRS
ncbi:abortive infection family protein [Nitrospirillum amazonense]|uniref:abortive infection family protein n=1 Tax=Nitrospirillum amazonense TaxID=28077 RepID=UPI002412BD24|nr:abortive infection family protein [Nitrospirillum amazonense]MDG3440668.1 abortive infection family protein [Nitrospirillum amazonense]